MTPATGRRRIEDTSFGWVILTMGDRPGPLAEAVGSALSISLCRQVVVVCNGADSSEVAASLTVDSRLHVIECAENLGIPGGRDFGLDCLESSIALVGFLDDDAVLRSPGLDRVITQAFGDPDVAAVSLKIVDETGTSSRRHIPRPGNGSGDRSGAVVTFLGGACILRRSAYEDVGGFWPALWYGHEELDLSWRLADAGWSVRYEADAEVVHPRAEISRHPKGWRLTGRNRVMVARRNLPLPVLALHTVFWLAVGLVRAPAECRRAYLTGWWRGWFEAVNRRPIGWATVWRLTRLGRPPLI